MKLSPFSINIAKTQWAIPEKKSKQGGLRISFSEPTLEFLDLSLYP